MSAHGVGPLDLSATTFLVGAGISIDPPSCIPPAALLGDALAGWLHRAAPELLPVLEDMRADPSTREPWQGPFATLRFEVLLDWLSYFRPELLTYLDVLDDAGYPNEWHCGLAVAIYEGARVLTTNFDTRIEEACEFLGVSCPTVVVSRACPGHSALEAARLIKLHGTFPGLGRTERERDLPVGTLSQIARFGLSYSRLERLRETIRPLFESRTVVVMGYSGWDSYDVVPLLESADRLGHLLWHDFSAGPGLTVGPAPLFDTLVEARPGHRPADLLLAEQSVRFPGRTWRLAGPTRQLFDLLWPPEPRASATSAAAEIRDSVADESLSAEASLRSLQDILHDEGYRLDGDTARLIVWAMRSIDFLEEEDELPETEIGRSYRPPPVSAESEELAREAFAEERFVDTAAAFLAMVRAQETDGPFDMAYNPAVFWSLDYAFDRAVEAGRQRQAWRIARMIRREGRRRRSLAAEIHGMFLEAVVHHHWAERAASGDSRLRRPSSGYADTARALLDLVITHALRLPKLDLLVAALRRRRRLEDDDVQGLRLEAAIRAWSSRLPPSEERLLAAFDLLQWQACRGAVDGANDAVAEIEAVTAAAPDLASASAVLAFARWHRSSFVDGGSASEALADLEAAIIQAPRPLASELRSARSRLINRPARPATRL